MSPGVQRYLLVIGSLLLVAMGLHWVLRATPPDQIETLESGDRVSIFRADQERGLVLLVHSVFQDVPTTYPMARALRNSGLTTLAVHLKPGRQFHEYKETLLRLSQTHSKKGPVYLVGHSMGGDLVADLASSEPSIKAVASLGFPANTDLLNCPTLLAAGVWDQVHHPLTIKEAAAGNTIFFCPTCDHSQESLDPFLQSTVIRHFGGKPSSQMGNEIVGLGLVMIGTFLVTFVVLPRNHTRYFPLVSLVISGLGQFVFPSTLWTAFFLSTTLAGAARRACHQDPTIPLWKLGKQCGAFFLIVGLSWILQVGSFLFQQPMAFLGLPIAVLSWPPILCARICHMAAWSYQGIPLGLVVIAIIEVLFPGRVVGSFLGYLVDLQRRLRNLKFQGLTKPTTFQTVFLSILILSALVLWNQVGAAGYSLEGAEMWRMAYKFGVLIIMPLALFGLIQRIKPLES